MVTLSLILMIYLAQVCHIKCVKPPITAEEIAVALMTNKHPTLQNAKKQGEAILNLVHGLTKNVYYEREKFQIAGELIARIEILIEAYPALKNTKNKSEHCLNLLRRLIEEKCDEERSIIIGKLQAYVEIFVEAAISNEIQGKQSDKDKKSKEEIKKLTMGNVPLLEVGQKPRNQPSKIKRRKTSLAFRDLTSPGGANNARGM